ncbi:MAG: inositol monophosphatase family protein [Planctomycetota bacterium]|nr:inositol monophosphatase family protein [Planctomycetota bacterium]MCX8004641.1 inositol monophosphatase family protein [Burkholderiaceae bacterium]MDW8373671.1 inositol monophosphatase family protein [Planctomycetota bacterium]
MSSDDDLRFVRELARAVAAEIAPLAGRVRRETKTHAAAQAETVTECDRAAQRRIVAALRARFPADGVIGEEDEHGEGITRIAGGGRVWVIDPIDGTNNFVAGFGCFAVCIARLDDGVPALGVVHDATRGISYAAARGCGAWADERPLRCRAEPYEPNDLLMLTCNLVRSDGSLPPWFLRWCQEARKLRMLGSAALEAMAVAAGQAQAAITLHGKLWDLAAPAAIVEAAGGIVSGLDGAPLFPIELRSYQGARIPFVAAAPRVHAALLAELASARGR